MGTIVSTRTDHFKWSTTPFQTFLHTSSHGVHPDFYPDLQVIGIEYPPYNHNFRHQCTFICSTTVTKFCLNNNILTNHTTQCHLWAYHEPNCKPVSHFSRWAHWHCLLLLDNISELFCHSVEVFYSLRMNFLLREKSFCKNYVMQNYVMHGLCVWPCTCNLVWQHLAKTVQGMIVLGLMSQQWPVSMCFIFCLIPGYFGSDLPWMNFPQRYDLTCLMTLTLIEFNPGLIKASMRE